MSIFETKRRWYVAGLAFECIECGNCCAGPGEGYVWLNDREITAIAHSLGITPEEMRRTCVRKVGRRKSLIEQKPSHDCIFLDEAADGRRLCRVYEVRPTQCRTWPFWKSNIHSAETWAEAATRCPGINRGRLYSPEEIEALAERTSD